jgi:hypothetical protein
MGAGAPLRVTYGALRNIEAGLAFDPADSGAWAVHAKTLLHEAPVTNTTRRSGVGTGHDVQNLVGIESLALGAQMVHTASGERITQPYLALGLVLKRDSTSVPWVQGTAGVSLTDYGKAGVSAVRGFAGVGLYYSSGLVLMGEYQTASRQVPGETEALMSAVARYPVNPRLAVQVGATNGRDFAGGDEMRIFAGLTTTWETREPDNRLYTNIPRTTTNVMTVDGATVMRIPTGSEPWVNLELPRRR